MAISTGVRRGTFAPSWPGAATDPQIESSPPSMMGCGYGQEGFVSTVQITPGRSGILGPGRKSTHRRWRCARSASMSGETGGHALPLCHHCPPLHPATPPPSPADRLPPFRINHLYCAPPPSPSLASIPLLSIPSQSLCVSLAPTLFVNFVSVAPSDHLHLVTLKVSLGCGECDVLYRRVSRKGGVNLGCGEYHVFSNDGGECDATSCLHNCFIVVQRISDLLAYLTCLHTLICVWMCSSSLLSPMSRPHIHTWLSSVCLIQY